MRHYTKKEFFLIYGSTYMIIAILETILFTLIDGRWSFRDIILNFSIWGLIWLVSMFAYPVLFTSADPSKLQLSPYFALLGYVIIILCYYVAYQLHKRFLERTTGKKLHFSKLMDLYFPIKE